MAIVPLCESAQQFDDDFTISQDTKHDFAILNFLMLPMPYLMCF